MEKKNFRKGKQIRWEGKGERICALSNRTCGKRPANTRYRIAEKKKRGPVRAVSSKRQGGGKRRSAEERR